MKYNKTAVTLINQKVIAVFNTQAVKDRHISQNERMTIAP